MSAASRAASRWPVIWVGFRASTPRADGRSWVRSPSRATACCACCWWKRRRSRCVTIPSFVESICIAVTRSRKLWLRWQRHASWRYDCTGCCARRGRIRTSFASRAARGWPWSARARPKELIGRSRIPHRRDVRIAESWPSVRSNRWLVERFHRRVIQVRFPESWSSTFSGEKAVLTHRPGYFCLDNAFALIDLSRGTRTHPVGDTGASAYVGDPYAEDRKLVELLTVWSLRDARQVQSMLGGAGRAFFMGGEKATGGGSVGSNFCAGGGRERPGVSWGWGASGLGPFRPVCS